MGEFTYKRAVEMPLVTTDVGKMMSVTVSFSTSSRGGMRDVKVSIRDEGSLVFGIGPSAEFDDKVFALWTAALDPLVNDPALSCAGIDMMQFVSPRVQDTTRYKDMAFLIPDDTPITKIESMFVRAVVNILVAVLCNSDMFLFVNAHMGNNVSDVFFSDAAYSPVTSVNCCNDGRIRVDDNLFEIVKSGGERGVVYTNMAGGTVSPVPSLLELTNRANELSGVLLPIADDILNDKYSDMHGLSTSKDVRKAYALFRKLFGVEYTEDCSIDDFSKIIVGVATRKRIYCL